jgi:hypothetical protein
MPSNIRHDAPAWPHDRAGPANPILNPEPAQSQRDPHFHLRFMRFALNGHAPADLETANPVH